MKKRTSWNEIEKKYPDMWALMANVKREQGCMVDCELICAVPFEQMASTAKKLEQQGIKFAIERTTDNMPNMGALT
ncbi:MAG: hypothetical protein K5649_04505 [Lachnospiraceae bacterium]|nr:hypothetical protein [Lachnospiraceae bacterium]